MADSVSGRRALVTGASQGIGAAVARRLARGGAAVIVASRRLDACEALAAELRGKGGDARALALDVERPESIEALLAGLRGTSAPIDWLVNNAGGAATAPLHRPRDEQGRDLFEHMLALNFHGARRLVEALLPGMRERGYGRIVNVASSAGLQGYAYSAAYCAAKHALVGYTRAAAVELERTGVRVGAVCPHYVDTPMLDGSIERVVRRTGRDAAGVREFFREQNPGGRFVTVDQVADAVWRLLTDDAAPLLLELDGGEPTARS